MPGVVGHAWPPTSLDIKLEKAGEPVESGLCRVQAIYSSGYKQVDLLIPSDQISLGKRIGGGKHLFSWLFWRGARFWGLDLGSNSALIQPSGRLGQGA
jgi:hypothetical protein